MLMDYGVFPVFASFFLPHQCLICVGPMLETRLALTVNHETEQASTSTVKTDDLHPNWAPACCQMTLSKVNLWSRYTDMSVLIPPHATPTVCGGQPAPG